MPLLPPPSIVANVKRTTTPSGTISSDQLAIPVVVLTTLDRTRRVELLCFRSFSIPEPRVDRNSVIAACSGGWTRIFDLEGAAAPLEFQMFEPKVNPDTLELVLDKNKQPEQFVGLYEVDGIIIAATSFGNVHYFPTPVNAPTNTTSDESQLPKVAEANPLLPKSAVSVGLGITNLCCMRVFPGSPNFIATGGNDRDLCVWKLETDETQSSGFRLKEMWKAKNVRSSLNDVKNDYLDLRVPVHITDIQFISPNEAEPSKVATVSHHRHFRVYDLKGIGRRPMVTIEIGANPLKRLTLVNDEKEALASDNKGNVFHIDVSTGKTIGTFRGIAGTVSSLAGIPKVKRTKDLSDRVAVVGADRFLRVYEGSGKRRSLRSIYLKQRMTALLVDPTWDPPAPDNDSKPKTGRKRQSRDEMDDDEDGDSDADDDALWDRFEVVRDGSDNDEAETSMAKAKKLKAATSLTKGSATAAAVAAASAAKAMAAKTRTTKGAAAVEAARAKVRSRAVAAQKQQISGVGRVNK
ncbi:hypothetical protein DFJ73DRAFT_765664 [Zopfochytrium polystomum]|nr:hypothetical protein DFJ73DRAFT_765664 [Zopfochytrium polystomum]